MILEVIQADVLEPPSPSTWTLGTAQVEPSLARPTRHLRADLGHAEAVAEASFWWIRAWTTKVHRALPNTYVVLGSRQGTRTWTSWGAPSMRAGLVSGLGQGPEENRTPCIEFPKTGGPKIDTSILGSLVQGLLKRALNLWTQPCTTSWLRDAWSYTRLPTRPTQTLMDLQGAVIGSKSP